MTEQAETTSISILFDSANSWMTNRDKIVQVQEGHPFIYATTSNGVKPLATALANHEPTSGSSNRLNNESQSVEFNDFERINLLCGGFLLFNMKRQR